MADIYDTAAAAEDEKFLEPDNLGRLPLVGRYLEKRPKVAVIRLAGVIADEGRRGKPGISHKSYAKIIDKAFAKADSAVALVINSPGGMPAQAELIGAQIRRAAAEKKLPVYAFVEDVAASGGYWLACAADYIYAQNTSIVGSIGVISAGFGFEELIAKYGVKRRIHTAGRDKSFMDPFVAEKDEDLKRLATIQHDIHGIFIDWVKERRGARLRGEEAEIFSGAFWTAGLAMDHGLIDGIADMQGLMQGRFGDKVKFIDCAPAKKFALMPQIPGIDAGDIIGAADNEAHWGRYGL